MIDEIGILGLKTSKLGSRDREGGLRSVFSSGNWAQMVFNVQATHYFSDKMDSNSVDSILPWLVEPEGTGGPTLLYSISAAIDIKACSTLVAFLAEVSRNGMPNWSAHSCNNLKSEIFVE